MPIPRIIVSSGEPAGIGPDLCIQLAQQDFDGQLVILADPHVLKARAQQLNLPLKIEYHHPEQAASTHQTGILKIWPVKTAEAVITGQLNKHNSQYVLEMISLATQACLQGEFDAMVTAPVHKGIINDAGIPFSGHTEYIAEISGGHPVMLLATPGLRVALATTHLPLSEVSAAITQQRLMQVITILNNDLKSRFKLKNPHILICGLNPHAGENGHLGHEEIEVIQPVINQLRQQGFNLHGPLPADTLFTDKYLKSADAVLAMYHDQGLPVLKHKGFGQAANITLGLPLIRTSVDHGTALDLAGTGQAEFGSMRYALHTALEMTSA